MSVVALVAMSHSPLLGKVELPSDVAAEVDGALAAARAFAEDFAPDLVISFSPDHYNGFFYRLMPPFCLGTAAVSIGDYGTAAGSLDVPRELASRLAQAVLDEGIDLSVSMDMKVDHGTVQPLEILFGGIDRCPLVPLFVNSVAPPFAPMARVRALGEAVGRFAAVQGKRVLLLSSGGLSHDPPVPRLSTATAAQVELLMGRAEATAETRAQREGRVLAAAQAHVRGEVNDGQPIATDWDLELLGYLRSGDLEPLDRWTAAEMARTAGNSAHEVRTWLAGHAALRAVGPYDVDFGYYRPINELLTGFGVQTLRLR